MSYPKATATLAIVIALTAAIMLSSVVIFIPQAHAAAPIGKGQDCKPAVDHGLQQVPPCKQGSPKQR